MTMSLRRNFKQVEIRLHDARAAAVLQPGLPVPDAAGNQRRQQASSSAVCMTMATGVKISYRKQQQQQQGDENINEIRLEAAGLQRAHPPRQAHTCRCNGR